MDRPLRLAVDEASALLVALRMLAEIGQVGPVPGLDEGQALNRTIAKLEAAAGEAAVPHPGGHRGGQDCPAGRPGPAPGRPARRRCICRITSRAGDEATERDVDPMRLLIVEGRTNLEGWCRRAEAVRLFRLDRVLALDRPRGGGRGARGRPSPVDVDQGLFRPSAQDLNVIIDLAPLGRWVAEYYPATPSRNSVTGGSGSRRVPRIPAWVRRLALRLGKTAGSWPRPT